MVAKKSKRATRASKSITSKVESGVASAARSVKRAVKKTIRGKQYGTLHELLILKLRSLYDIEVELIKTLPKLARAAASPDLREAFEAHLRETEVHAGRLEQAMRMLGIEPAKEKVAGIRGIAEDGDWIANHTSARARDAALIAAAQYAEHYEIAGYQSAREWAAMMDHAEVADLLDATLMEEEAANQKLQELAHNGINQKAGGIPMEEESADEREPAIL